MIYVGEFKNNLYDGEGKRFRTVEINGESETYVSYEGGFSQGMPSGQGTAYRMDESGGVTEIQYSGEYVEGMYCGNGEYFGEDEQGDPFHYKGSFFEGNYWGYGIRDYYIRDGEEAELRHYYGTFINGSYSGKGKVYDENMDLVYSGEWENGNLIYSGGWKNGEREGEGTLYYSSFENVEDCTLKGTFVEGRKEGDFSLFDHDGRLVMTITYENDTEISREEASRQETP